METYIKDLNLSAEVKAALLWSLQITKVSEFEKLNYLTFANKCPKNVNALAIAGELNALGYLYPPENEISVNDIPMSKRLQNVLMRNNILYLSQLSERPREEILKFRNMGKIQCRNLTAYAGSMAFRYALLLLSGRHLTVAIFLQCYINYSFRARYSAWTTLNTRQSMIYMSFASVIMP